MDALVSFQVGHFVVGLVTSLLCTGKHLLSLGLRQVRGDKDQSLSYLVWARGEGGQPQLAVLYAGVLGSKADQQRQGGLSVRVLAGDEDFLLGRVGGLLGWGALGEGRLGGQGAGGREGAGVADDRCTGGCRGGRRRGRGRWRGGRGWRAGRAHRQLGVMELNQELRRAG